MQSNEELKKRLLDMLEEDKEFRHAVAGAIGYKEILDRIVALEERMEERFAKVDERFLRLETEMNERFAKVEEEIRDLRAETNRLRQDMLEGFRRHDEEFKRVWESIEQLRRDMNEGFMRLDLKISAVGARWGIMNEQPVREGLKGIIQKELGYTVSEWNAYDDEGYVYGYPSNIQMDIVISDSKIIAVEVTSHVKRSDPFTLKKKAELYRKKEGKEISRVIFVTSFIDDDAIVACNRLGIEVYTA